MSAASARADHTYSDNAARLEKMTADQKEELRRKKLRFDGLNSDEQQRLRDLHAELTKDANATELMDTARSYNRWLATLDSAERSTLLDIKDPHERIARIKELMQQQEERRFRDYAGNLPEEDRGAIYKWVGEWVIGHADQIREQTTRDFRQRIDDAPDEESRRRALISSWQQGRQRQSPSTEEYSELFKRLSSETQKTIESLVSTELAKEPEEQRTRERQQALQQQRLADIVRIALWTRNFPLVSQEELLKFYAEMKTDDPRRKQLEGKEGGELRRELLFMYNRERFGRGGGGPGGPGRGFGPAGPGPGGFGPWGPPPGGPRGEGRGGRPDGKPGDRFDERDRGGKPPPGERP